jgi:hypothetical protein
MTKTFLDGSEDWNLYVSTGEKIQTEASNPALNLRKLVLLCNTYDATSQKMREAQTINAQDPCAFDDELPTYEDYSSASVQVLVEEVTDLSDDSSNESSDDPNSSDEESRLWDNGISWTDSKSIPTICFSQNSPTPSSTSRTLRTYVQQVTKCVYNKFQRK